MIYDCTVFFLLSSCFFLFYAQHWHFEWRSGICVCLCVYMMEAYILFLVIFFGRFLYIMKECDI